MSRFSCNELIYGYGAFMCNDRSKCVTSNYKCDGIGQPDCADGSDESEETCGVKKTTTDAPTTAVELETEKPVTQDPSELVCISTGECENDKEKRKAGEREVPYSVSLECRKCVNPGFTEEQLCAKKVTTGCTEEVEPASTGTAATLKPDESTSSPAATTGAAAKDNSCAKDGGDMRDQCMTPEEITNAGATDAKDLVFSTSIKCRMCVTGKTKEELCKAKVTEGCEEEVTEVETRTAEEKKTDEKTTVLRVSSDIEDKDALNIALLDKIRNKGGQIRSAQILAVEIEAVRSSRLAPCLGGEPGVPSSKHRTLLSSYTHAFSTCVVGPPGRHADMVLTCCWHGADMVRCFLAEYVAAVSWSGGRVRLRPRDRVLEAVLGHEDGRRQDRRPHLRGAYKLELELVE